MAVSMNVKKVGSACVDGHQVCARGWQDYMLETRFFLAETRVGDALKGFDGKQLEKLGLSSSEVRMIHAR